MKTHRPTFRSDEHSGTFPEIPAQTPFKGSDPYRHVAVAYSPNEEVIPIGVRVGKNQLEKYSEELTERDREILASLESIDAEPVFNPTAWNCFIERVLIKQKSLIFEFKNGENVEIKI